LFDNNYELLYNGENIKDVVPLNSDTYTLGGTTALLDAIGRTVNDVNKRLTSTVKCGSCGHEEQKPKSKVLVAVLTDGLENASSDFSKKQINELIDKQSKEYDWQFMFLAANQDAISAGMSLGISANTSFNFAHSKTGVEYAYNVGSTYTTSIRTKSKAEALDDLKNYVDANASEVTTGSLTNK